MKKVEIRKFTHAEVDEPRETFGFLKIPAHHELIRAEGENLEVSDGYHTFDELYDHRIELYIKLCNVINNDSGYGYVWRSKQHHVGGAPMYDGWFILGIGIQSGEQISYHLPINR